MAATSLSPEEFPNKRLSDEHADVLREGLAWLVREPMESEVAESAGAALHERNPANGFHEGKGGPP